MSVCSFAKDYFTRAVTNVDNRFITEYLPLADGNAVKIYLFGLSLCQSGLEYTLDDFAKSVNLSTEEVIEYFKFWEDFDLVQIISQEPFTVRYQPISTHTSKLPRKYNAEKYTQFSKDIQALIPNRMISTSEFTEYYNLMEIYGIKPEAMLMICKYCVDKKGETITYKYISQVAKDFGIKGLTTEKAIEKELQNYYSKNSDIVKILTALGSKKEPELQDNDLLKKWTKEMGYDVDTLIFCAGKCKKTMAKLDTFITELYASKKYTVTEINDFLAQKEHLKQLTLDIAKELGLYIEVVETYSNEYVSKWLSYGFDDKGLKAIARYCFKREENRFESMDSMVITLKNDGIITFDSIAEYFRAIVEDNNTIKQILETMGIPKKHVTAWDRNNYKTWKLWNFTDEMILKAAELSSGKNNPIPYLNAILGQWKNLGIYSVEQIPDRFNKPESAEKEKTKRKDIVRKVIDNNYNKAMQDSQFKMAEEQLPIIEKDLAFAIFKKNDEKRIELEALKDEYLAIRNSALMRLGFTETDIPYPYVSNENIDNIYTDEEINQLIDKVIDLDM